MNQQSFKTVAYPMVESSTYAIENKHNNRYHYTNPRRHHDYSFSRSLGLGSPIPSSLMAKSASLSGKHGLS